MSRSAYKAAAAVVAGCGLTLSAPDAAALSAVVDEHADRCARCAGYAAALRSAAARRAGRVTSPRRKAASVKNVSIARATLKSIMQKGKLRRDA